MQTIPASKPIFDKGLIEKYDRTGPRYTSYPTAVQFTDRFSVADYLDQAKRSNELPAPYPLSLYFHIPFCQTLCFYCACNKIITKRKEKAVQYLDYMHREIEMQARLFEHTRPVTQLHLGGGSPTFLSHEQIDTLIEFTAKHFTFAEPEQRDFSIEIDPRTIDFEYLAALSRTGINRISFGVQDFNPVVQKAVHRVQSQQQTTEMIEHSRSLGIKSISIDLIYGLPFQTIDSVAETLQSIIALKPDRLSLFNYAHLPNRFQPQQRINAEELPSSDHKLQILKNAIDVLDDAGYIYIGMDHLALPNDDLAKARNNGTLRRNFQGYSSHRHTDLLGMGVSSISSVGTCNAQNYKTLEQYYPAIDSNRLPIERGYTLNQDDLERHFVIMQLMCYEALKYSDFEAKFQQSFTKKFATELKQLEQMQQDGLLKIDPHGLNVLPTGRVLLRNIAMVFDVYLSNQANTKNFSRTI